MNVVLTSECMSTLEWMCGFRTSERNMQMPRYAYEFRTETVKREVTFHTGAIYRDGEKYVQLADYKKPQEVEQALTRTADTFGIPLHEVKR